MNGEKLEEGETEGREGSREEIFILELNPCFIFLSSQFLKHSLYSNVFYSILLKKKYLKLLSNSFHDSKSNYPCNKSLTTVIKLALNEMNDSH